MRSSNERGIALITVLMVMALMSALLVGFTAIVMSDQRYRFIDRDRGQAFYGAAAGIEKMTADLGNLFLVNLAPTAAQVTALTVTAKQPVIPTVTFTAGQAPGVLPASSLTRCIAPNVVSMVGTNGYTIQFCAAPGGNPTPSSTTPIKTGPYEGLVAQQTPYQMDVSAKTSTGGEVHLVRNMDSVAIPVFQFGIFSDVDLAFFAGPDFSFGGRVHTNGNLFLSQGDGATLTLSDKVTAVKEIIRQRLENGVSIDTGPAHTGTVNMARAPAVYRALARTEGSLVDGVGSAKNEPMWHTVSLSTYNSWIRNGRTGAKTLNLPLTTVGGSNPDLVRRPPPGENTSNAVLFGERLFSKASLRILLSDTTADISNLPMVTTAVPVQLDGNWRTTPPNNGTAYGPVDASHPPIARSPGLTTATITTGATITAGTNKTLPIPLGTPAAWKIPVTITVNKLAAPAATYTVTCTGKGASVSAATTTFTGCISVPVNPAISWTTSPTPTVTAALATADGNISISTTLAANWPAAGGTIQVASTMAFAPNTFWVNGRLVTCGGYDATNLLGCTLSADIPSGSSAITNAARSNAGTGTIGGFLKIDRQNTDGTWTDVTMEILNYGIGAPNLDGAACADPTPNAIIRLQRLRDNNWTACNYPILNAAGAVSPVSTDYWPNVLYDPREGLQRDTNYPGATTLTLGGVMHYVEIDTANLAKWFNGTAPFSTGTGTLSKTDNGGFTVYFSDRRNNRDATSLETGEYGWEDFVNPAGVNGTPNGVLDAGEDVNGNNALDVYGGVPNYAGTANTTPPGASAPLTTAARPTTTLDRGIAQVNRAIIFRRALKLINGSTLSALGLRGLTVAAENPVYVQGNWNANGSFAGAHAATAVIADAVTLLSNNWTDSISFSAPYDPTSRSRVTPTWYRLGIIAGKGIAFPQPAGAATDFGTDGGAHNFLRYLENGDQPVNYTGSIATFFYNRQAVGTYKCCTTVYGAPTRNYAFDIDFLNPALLPPNTPVFRDMNTVGFSQELRPGR